MYNLRFKIIYHYLPIIHFLRVTTSTKKNPPLRGNFIEFFKKMLGKQILIKQNQPYQLKLINFRSFFFWRFIFQRKVLYCSPECFNLSMMMIVSKLMMMVPEQKMAWVLRLLDNVHFRIVTLILEHYFQNFVDYLNLYFLQMLNNVWLFGPHYYLNYCYVMRMNFSDCPILVPDQILD